MKEDRVLYQKDELPKPMCNIMDKLPNGITGIKGIKKDDGK